MEHSGQLQGGHLTWVYLHSGVVELCSSGFNWQGGYVSLGPISRGTSDLGISAFWCSRATCH